MTPRFSPRSDAASRLHAAVEALADLTEGKGRIGTATWPECCRDAYSLAIEEAQTALRALLAASPITPTEAP